MRQSVAYSQNFLHNSELIDQLINRASITSSDTVLDIGAGSGSITRALAKRAKEVIAYESDTRLADNLARTLEPLANVRIVGSNFLEQQVPAKDYKVFANIPFNVTSAIVHKLYDGETTPEESYLVIQQEAALKFAGSPSRNTLFSTLNTPWLVMDIIHHFKPADFTPRPKVNVVLLRISKRRKPLVNPAKRRLFTDLVSYIFNHANPNILPALRKLFPGSRFASVELALDPKVTAKPGQMIIEDWLALFDIFDRTSTQIERRLVAGTHRRLVDESKRVEKHHRTRVSKNWLDESRRSSDIDAG